MNEKLSLKQFTFSGVQKRHDSIFPSMFYFWWGYTDNYCILLLPRISLGLVQKGSKFDEWLTCDKVFSNQSETVVVENYMFWSVTGD